MQLSCVHPSQSSPSLVGGHIQECGRNATSDATNEGHTDSMGSSASSAARVRMVARARMRQQESHADQNLLPLLIARAATEDKAALAALSIPSQGTASATAIGSPSKCSPGGSAGAGDRSLMKGGAAPAASTFAHFQAVRQANLRLFTSFKMLRRDCAKLHMQLKSLQTVLDGESKLLADSKANQQAASMGLCPTLPVARILAATKSTDEAACVVGTRMEAQRALEQRVAAATAQVVAMRSRLMHNLIELGLVPDKRKDRQQHENDRGTRQRLIDTDIDELAAFKQSIVASTAFAAAWELLYSYACRRFPREQLDEALDPRASLPNDLQRRCLKRQLKI